MDVTGGDPPRPLQPRARWRWLAHALALALLALVAVGVVLILATPRGVTTPGGDSASRYGWSQITLAVPFLVAGWLLAARRPEVPFGWLALAAAFAHAGAGAGSGWTMAAVYGGHDLPGVVPVGILNGAFEATEPVVLATTWATFPYGRFPRGRIGRLAAVSIGLCAVGWLSGPLWDFKLVDPPPKYADVTNPIGVPFPGWLPVLLFASGLLLGSVVMVVRWLRAEGELRQVLRWLAVVNALAIVSTPLVVALPAGAVITNVGTVVELVVVVAVVLANRVYGIEVVLNRALVYVLLTAFVAAVYAAGVAVLAAFGQAVGGPWSVGAALGAAFSLAPAHSRVQRIVNRFLYGERDEPHTVATRVAARLETAGSVEALLPSLVEALAATLRLPRATVELRGDDGSVRAITYADTGNTGSEADRFPGGATARFPLVHQGEDIGALVVGLRSGQSTLGARESRLLADIARQVAVAASNVRLTEALMRSRERIVSAAEEERRRLRRDLHDGLGPVLTAAATKLDAARNLAGRDLPRATNLLADVRRDLTSALGDLRRLVYALRPPALDELGLLAALRETLRGAAVPVTLTAPGALPPLPAAVEVAAYRIVTEAVTNVARHAGATRCDVTIGCGATLTIEIRDDGQARGPEAGTASMASWTPGVGLTSMRERATALGGTWSGGPTAAGGRVVVELPRTLAGSGVPRLPNAPYRPAAQNDANANKANANKANVDDANVDDANVEDAADTQLAGSTG